MDIRGGPVTGIRATVAQQERLLDVLDLDTEATRLRRAMADASEQLAILETDADFLELVRESAYIADLCDENSTEIKHAELDLKIAQDRITRDRTHELTVTDAKDVSSLEHEIASLERRVDALTAALVNLYSVRDELTERRTEADAARDDFHARRAIRETEIRDVIGAHQQRLDAIDRDRAVILAELPADLSALYERQRERYGVGASRLIGTVTTASGVTLSEGQLQEIRSADEDDVVLCPVSDAILVRTGKPAV